MTRKYQTKEQIIQDYLSTDLTKWTKIKNVLNPPIHFIQSFETADGNEMKIRSEGYCSHSFNKVKETLHNFDLFMKMMPELEIVKTEDNLMEAVVHFPLTNQNYVMFL